MNYSQKISVEFFELDFFSKFAALIDIKQFRKK